VPALTAEIENDPNLVFRIDSFTVPEASREEFEGAMHRNLAFLETLPGFRGHLVFRKTSGPSAFDVVTLAVWERGAAERAAAEVRAYYQRIGFDPAASMARWRVRGELGNYEVERRPRRPAGGAAAAATPSPRRSTRRRAARAGWGG